MAVVSARIPDDVLAKLRAYQEKQGVSVTRQLIDGALQVSRWGKISDENWKILNNYELSTGVPITHSVNAAIRDYCEVVIPARLDSLRISHSENKERRLEKSA